MNAFFETERLTLLTGELSEHTVKAGSGGPHVIVRCQDCGTALWSHYPRLGKLGPGLRGGTLEDSGAFVPDAAIFSAERMPWMALPLGIPAFEETYDFRESLSQGREHRKREKGPFAARLSQRSMHPRPLLRPCP